jgi:hypothetical protein
LHHRAHSSHSSSVIEFVTGASKDRCAGIVDVERLRRDCATRLGDQRSPDAMFFLPNGGVVRRDNRRFGNQPKRGESEILF